MTETKINVYRSLSTDEIGVLHEYHRTKMEGAGAALSRLPDEEAVHKAGMTHKAFENALVAMLELKAAQAERHHDDFLVGVYVRLARWVRSEAGTQFVVTPMRPVTDR